MAGCVEFGDWGAEGGIGREEGSAKGTMRVAGDSQFPISDFRFPIGGVPSAPNVPKTPKELSLLLVEAAEAERRRIGRELHDTLGQTATGLALLVGGLADRLATELPHERHAAEQIARAAQQAVAQVRALAHGLDPAPLGEGGLAEALRELAEQTQAAAGIPCRFRTRGAAALDEPAATHVYRIAQEAAANAARHARAGRIDLSLIRQDAAVVLRVADDGVGLSNEPRLSSGMGLRTMHARAEAIGAALRISPRPGGGTVVACSVPVHPKGFNPMPPAERRRA